MADIRVSISDGDRRGEVVEMVVRVPAVGEGRLLAVAGGTRLVRCPWAANNGAAAPAWYGLVANPLILPSLAAWVGRCRAEGIEVVPDPRPTPCRWDR